MTRRAAIGTDVLVGCAGWSIPSVHAGLFGEGDSALQRYATRFPIVEINSSFYRPHLSQTYERWARSVPLRFRFSVKLPKTITHEGRLHSSGRELDAFQAQVGGLGRKLGGVLVQIPPSLPFDARVAATFFGMLRRRFDVGIALEPRHASWFAPAATALLQRLDIARVAADPAPIDGAGKPLASSRWVYWRWHGSPRMYYSAYSDDRLAHLAASVRPAGAEPWVIFDNTAHGHAIADAVRLQGLLAAQRVDVKA